MANREPLLCLLAPLLLRFTGLATSGHQVDEPSFAPFLACYRRGLGHDLGGLDLFYDRGRSDHDAVTSPDRVPRPKDTAIPVDLPKGYELPKAGFDGFVATHANQYPRQQFTGAEAVVDGAEGFFIRSYATTERRLQTRSAFALRASDSHRVGRFDERDGVGREGVRSDTSRSYGTILREEGGAADGVGIRFAPTG